MMQPYRAQPQQPNTLEQSLSLTEVYAKSQFVANFPPKNSDTDKSLDFDQQQNNPGSVSTLSLMALTGRVGVTSQTSLGEGHLDILLPAYKWEHSVVLQDRAIVYRPCSAIRLHWDRHSGHRFNQCHHRPFSRLSHHTFKRHPHCRVHRLGRRLNNQHGPKSSSRHLRENRPREPYAQMPLNSSPVHPYLTQVMTDQIRGRRKILGSGLELRHRGASSSGRSTTMMVIKEEPTCSQTPHQSRPKKSTQS